jgi:dolichol-phosphate mannosyltransferase
LIPNLVKYGIEGRYPPFVSSETSRDFVYVGDVCEAFLVAAARLTPELYGESFNIGSGVRTKISDLAQTAREVFGIEKPADFGSMQPRAWDLDEWYAAPGKAGRLLGWSATTSLADGLRRSAGWIGGVDQAQSRPGAEEHHRHRRLLQG